jgi:ATP-binding cassette subfamily C protein LapB
MFIPGLKQNIDKNENFLKPEGFRQSVASLLLATLAINILSLSLPVMTLQVYDRILPNPGTGTLPVLITGVCLAILLEALLRLSRSYLISRSGAAYEHRMACGAMQKVLNADLSQRPSYGIGEYLHRMGSVGKLKEFHNGQSLITATELVFVPVFLMLIYYIAGPLIIIPAAILSVFCVLSLWKGYRLRRALKERDNSDDKRFNFLIEALEGIHTLKAFALEKFFQRRYETLEEESCLKNYKVTQETASTFNNGAIFSHLMVTSVITFGAWLVLHGQLTMGGLIATLLLSGRIMQPVQKALTLWARYQDFSIARDNIKELFTTPQQIIMPNEGEITPMPEGLLELENLSFRSRDADLFKNVNLQIKPGEVIQLSGGHGAGKTMLLNLIAGIYPPTEGHIDIDGQNINKYKPEELVRHVGLIRSRPLIFRGTIRDNITCFGQTNETQAKEVAALLSVDQDVAKLPGGFDTFLTGTNTDVIAPGLKQRIAMVRVLATKPRLILFDNADRVLDREGYSMIYSLLARLRNKASLILVTDDQNLRGLATQHYHLENGSLEQRDLEVSKGNIRPYKELRL